MKIKTKELRQKTREELTRTLDEQRQHLGKAYFDLAAGKTRNVKECRTARRTIARVLTVMAQKGT